MKNISRARGLASASKGLVAVVALAALTACGSSTDGTSNVAASQAPVTVDASPTGLPPDFLLYAGCSAIASVNSDAVQDGRATLAESVLTTSDAINALGLADNAAPPTGPNSAVPKLTLPPTPQVVVTQLTGKFSSGIQNLSGATSSWPPSRFTSQLVFRTPNGQPIERTGDAALPLPTTTDPVVTGGAVYDQLAQSIRNLASLGAVYKTTPAECDRKLGPVPTEQPRTAPPT